MDSLLNGLLGFKSTFFTILFFLALYFVIKYVLDRQSKGKTDWSMIKTIILFSIATIGFISIILALPMSESLRSQVTSLMGIVISAVLALSSATFIGNGLAGIMLRAIGSFKHGDFIEVNDVFGRVTEKGLFHTEIQNENRDLTTLPNLVLTTNAVRVKRSSGTVIASEVSLGYDVPRVQIEKALVKAGKSVGLKDPFVLITGLGDFSVVYKLQGMLQDVKTIISAKSRLNAAVLDALHDENIEIVSPSFMNQRPISDTLFIPKKVKEDLESKDAKKPESMIFDKAEEAEGIENRKQIVADLDKKIIACDADIAACELEEDKQKFILKKEKLKAQKEKLIQRIENKIEEIEKE